MNLTINNCQWPFFLDYTTHCCPQNIKHILLVYLDKLNPLKPIHNFSLIHQDEKYQFILPKIFLWLYSKFHTLINPFRYGSNDYNDEQLSFKKETSSQGKIWYLYFIFAHPCFLIFKLYVCKFQIDDVHQRYTSFQSSK